MSVNNIAALSKNNELKNSKRPISTSFNELSRINSTTKKDHGKLIYITLFHNQY